ncbi:hypothetical protein DSO57_1006977 [Entomophthora muscae]|uniref:Uncharacterized protein n=1 Tax=Entomophthora muscae TaxID=34485 RepID=A0ACC2UH77_9FUNG|nr:hypothetical protein DSO57_1006977 [Entomophthora muscae]
MTQDTLWGLVTRNPTSSVLTDKKINKVSVKVLMAKMPDTLEKTIENALNVQKTVVEGLQSKAYNFSVLSIWVEDPEMYEHLKPAQHARMENTEFLVQLLVPRIDKPAEAAGKENTGEGNIKN